MHVGVSAFPSPFHRDRVGAHVDARIVVGLRQCEIEELLNMPAAHLSGEMCKMD